MEIITTESADNVDSSVGHDVQKDRLLLEDNTAYAEDDNDDQIPATRKPFEEIWDYAASLAARGWKPLLITYGAIHLIVAAALDFRRYLRVEIGSSLGPFSKQAIHVSEQMSDLYLG